jgi:ubiquinone/menaquinone biosynthesis C-methylase UbiE
VLEVGIGSGIVTEVLKKIGIGVTTLDIDENLRPDVVGSVTEIPLPDASADVVLAAEILEHIPFNEFPRALEEMHRVSRRFAYITLPYPGYTFSFAGKAPMFPRFGLVLKIPFFWKRRTSTPEHYWELRLRGFPLRKIKREIKRAGFAVSKKAVYPDDPAHYHFLLEKRDFLQR